MRYKEALIEAMKWLGEKDDVVFLGQACQVSGHAISGTLASVPLEKRIELPVFEEMQMGISTGMALEGFTTVTVYPRFDFLLLAVNQLVNHLDKMKEMTNDTFKPRVIIRVSVGAKNPIDAGPQHTQDHSVAFEKMLSNIEVVRLTDPDRIVDQFKHAYNREDCKPTLFVEYGEFYGTR